MTNNAKDGEGRERGPATETTKTAKAAKEI